MSSEKQRLELELQKLRSERRLLVAHLLGSLPNPSLQTARIDFDKIDVTYLLSVLQSGQKRITLPVQRDRRDRRKMSAAGSTMTFILGGGGATGNADGGSGFGLPSFSGGSAAAPLQPDAAAHPSASAVRGPGGRGGRWLVGVKSASTSHLIAKPGHEVVRGSASLRVSVDALESGNGAAAIRDAAGPPAAGPDAAGPPVAGPDATGPAAATASAPAPSASASALRVPVAAAPAESDAHSNPKGVESGPSASAPPAIVVPHQKPALEQEPVELLGPGGLPLKKGPERRNFAAVSFLDFEKSPFALSSPPPEEFLHSTRPFSGGPLQTSAKASEAASGEDSRALSDPPGASGALVGSSHKRRPVSFDAAVDDAAARRSQPHTAGSVTGSVAAPQPADGGAAPLRNVRKAPSVPFQLADAGLPDLSERESRAVTSNPSGPRAKSGSGAAEEVQEDLHRHGRPVSEEQLKTGALELLLAHAPTLTASDMQLLESTIRVGLDIPKASYRSLLRTTAISDRSLCQSVNYHFAMLLEHPPSHFSSKQLYSEFVARQLALFLSGVNSAVKDNASAPRVQDLNSEMTEKCNILETLVADGRSLSESDVLGTLEGFEIAVSHLLGALPRRELAYPDPLNTAMFERLVSTAFDPDTGEPNLLHDQVMLLLERVRGALGMQNEALYRIVHAKVCLAMYVDHPTKATLARVHGELLRISSDGVYVPAPARKDGSVPAPAAAAAEGHDGTAAPPQPPLQPQPAADPPAGGPVPFTDSVAVELTQTVLRRARQVLSNRLEHFLASTLFKEPGTVRQGVEVWLHSIVGAAAVRAGVSSSELPVCPVAVILLPRPDKPKSPASDGPPAQFPAPEIRAACVEARKDLSALMQSAVREKYLSLSDRYGRPIEPEHWSELAVSISKGYDESVSVYARQIDRAVSSGKGESFAVSQLSAAWADAWRQDVLATFCALESCDEHTPKMMAAHKDILEMLRRGGVDVPPVNFRDLLTGPTLLWIRSTKKKMSQMVQRAVAADNWTPLGSSGHTSSAVDLAALIRQTLPYFLDMPLVEANLWALPLTEAIGDVCLGWAHQAAVEKPKYPFPTIKEVGSRVASLRFLQARMKRLDKELKAKGATRHVEPLIQLDQRLDDLVHVTAGRMGYCAVKLSLPQWINRLYIPTPDKHEARIAHALNVFNPLLAEIVACESFLPKDLVTLALEEALGELCRTVRHVLLTAKTVSYSEAHGPLFEEDVEAVREFFISRDEHGNPQGLSVKAAHTQCVPLSSLVNTLFSVPSADLIDMHTSAPHTDGALGVGVGGAEAVLSREVIGAVLAHRTEKVAKKFRGKLTHK